MLFGLLWSRHVEIGYLITGVAAWLTAAVLLLRSKQARSTTSLLRAAWVLLALSIAGQAFTAWRLVRLPTDWAQIIGSRQASTNALLDRTIGHVVDRGMRTATLAAERATTTKDTAALFRRLATLRDRSKVDAIAVFGEQGELVAWAGEHRAQIPELVRFGISGVKFIEQPLYSYIYFPAKIRGGSGHAVAAVLLSHALQGMTPDVDPSGTAHLMSEVGAVFHEGKGPAGSWQLVVRGDTVAHARFATPSQAQWRQSIITFAQRFELILALIVMLLLGIAWLRRTRRQSITLVPLGAGAFALAVAPLGALGMQQLFDPALFLLPLPGEISLGTLLAVLLTLAALAASIRAPARAPRTPTLLLFLGALAVAVGYPGAIRFLVGPGAAANDPDRAAGMQLLLGGPALWFGLQIAAVLLLGIITEIALPRWNWSSPSQTTTRWRSPWLVMLLGALATSAALSMSVLLLGQTKTWVSPLFAAAWALPFLLAGLAMAAYRGKAIRLIRWVTAGWLATSAVLPFMWVAHVDARLKAAEHDLHTLGATYDPYLEYLLMQFSRQATARAKTGESGYQLLWRSWLTSGLARESYPARITLWSPTGVPEVQLSWNPNESITPTDRPLAIPSYLESAFLRVREFPDSSELMRVQAVADVNQALILSPDSQQILTVEVAPRRSLEQPDLPFLGLNRRVDTHVELVPARYGQRPPRTWVPSGNGWRSETLVQFADGEYHAHMEVRLPRVGVRVARGMLLLAFNLALFTILWLLGRAARGEHLAVMSGWRNWRGSFRARVTATLFFFFLIPTAVFGWVAFGALTREVTRATQMVAERAVQQAVIEFKDSGGDLHNLATRAGAQVLYYLQGELLGSSSPEARELGVYGAWMPPDVFLTLTRADEDAAVRTRQISGQQVLTAYRTLIPAGQLAVPMPLESGETAIRQSELAHLILFAALIGGLLSLLLSVVVGRALTVPINRLARAAAQVGSGNLRVHMPENTGDEFGQLYASFNRMVRRLRRARSQEIRTARVLAWGEMARQVAHEIKNPLTPIKLAVQHLRRAYADRRPDYATVLDTNVEQVLLEIDRLSEIARAFSRYGAPALSTGPLEEVRVEQIVHEALTLYRAGDPDVEYQESVQPGIPHALGRAGELKEVLLNLLENARTALDGSGGTINVSARSTELGIELAVTDNGPGIPADFLQRVFEPHFSTRSSGTGLGLAIVRRLVESWGGSVTAESEVGVGTTIRIVLNRANQFDRG